MKTNILVAIYNLVNNPIIEIKKYYRFSNRINNSGESLEYYIKDILCNSVNEKNLLKKLENYSKFFSYSGSQNHPPDLMIKGGDAIEIKKIENPTSSLSLNSSYPKDKLFSDSPLITQGCRDCEIWKEKDIIYAIGCVKNDKLVDLWLVYGDCFAANSDIYEIIKDRLSKGISNLPDLDFSKTKEIGRINAVDPLKITYLRIRGMWGIEHPSLIFYYLKYVRSKKFTLNSIILKSKYDKFPVNDRSKLEKIHNSSFTISDIKIKNPNNPIKMVEAKLISYSI